MAKKFTIKNLTGVLQNQFNFDFKKSSSHFIKRLRNEKEDEGYLEEAYALDIAGDIKELLSDHNLSPIDKHFYVNTLIGQFFIVNLPKPKEKDSNIKNTK